MTLKSRCYRVVIHFPHSVAAVQHGVAATLDCLLLNNNSDHQLQSGGLTVCVLKYFQTEPQCRLVGTDQESDSDLAVINYLFIYLFTISTPDLRPDPRQDLSIIPGRIMRLFQQVFCLFHFGTFNIMNIGKVSQKKIISL